MTQKYLKKLEKLVDEWNEFAKRAGKSQSSTVLISSFVNDALLKQNKDSLDTLKRYINLSKKKEKEKEVLSKMQIKVVVEEGKIILRNTIM